MGGERRYGGILQPTCFYGGAAGTPTRSTGNGNGGVKSSKIASTQLPTYPNTTATMSLSGEGAGPMCPEFPSQWHRCIYTQTAQTDSRTGRYFGVCTSSDTQPNNTFRCLVDFAVDEMKPWMFPCLVCSVLETRRRFDIYSMGSLCASIPTRLSLSIRTTGAAL